MKKTNLEMIRGDTLSFGVELEYAHLHGEKVEPQKLDNAYFTVKKDFNDKEEVLRKSLDDGITFAKAEGNKVYYVVRVAPEDTEGVEAGRYYYDLQIGINNDIFTVLYGMLTVYDDVTR